MELSHHGPHTNQAPNNANYIDAENQWPSLGDYHNKNNHIEIMRARIWAKNKINTLKSNYDKIIFTDGSACPNTYALGAGIAIYDNQLNFIHGKALKGTELGTCFEAEAIAIRWTLKKNCKKQKK